MRRVLLLCVVIAAGLLAWWLLRDDAPTADVDRASAPASTAATPPPAKAPDRVSSRATPSETPAVAAPAPARPVEKIAEADAGGTLLVVDLATGQPLAGVHVAFVGVDAFPAEVHDAIDKDADSTDAILEHGRAFVSDEQGRVVLPKFSMVAIVAARHGELRGSKTVWAGPLGWRLLLHRPAALTALVQDTEGRPCGGVGVLLSVGEFTLRGATTDAKDGVARFGDALSYVSIDDGDTLALSVALPFADRPSVAADPKNLPADPVRLVLPPTGRVRCEVVGEQGSTASLLARLRRPARKVPGGLFRIGSSSLEDATATIADGVARFPYVGLGLELEVEVTSSDESRVTAKQKFAGPTVAGEETVVRVTVGGRRPAVFGRLADGKGAPIAGYALVAWITEPGTDNDWDERVECTTDAAGRFRFAFDRTAGDAASAKLEIGRSAGGSGIRSVRLIALVDLPAVLPGGEVDVGDVVYRGTGLLAAGVVVDEEGKPLADVTIAAMETGGGADRSPRYDVDSVESDAQGRFRLEGDPSAGRVVLGARFDGRFVADRLSFAAGSEDVRIVMLKAGGIAGSVRMPPGRDASQQGSVLIEGSPANNGDTEYRFRGEGLSASIGDDGKFEVRTLRPGRARVAIRLSWNKDDTILVVDGVEVVAGQVTRDPRLQDVDGSKALHALRVVVRDSDGKPLEGAEIHFRPVAADDYWKGAGTTDAEGAATVRAKTEDASGRGIDLIVTCRGYRSGAIRAAKSDTTIVLEPAKSSVVTVRLASGSPLPDPPFQLGASLQWFKPGAQDEAQRWHDPRDIRPYAAKFGKDRVLTFETYDAGRYRVELMLWKMRMNGGGGSGIDSVPETVVVSVAGDGAPAEVFVGVDAEDLKRRTSEER